MYASVGGLRQKWVSPEAEIKGSDDFRLSWVGEYYTESGRQVSTSVQSLLGLLFFFVRIFLHFLLFFAYPSNPKLIASADLLVLHN